MITKLSCPSCGGEVKLHSFNAYVVCAYCRQILVRENDAYLASGEVSEVADDYTPYQIDTEGWFLGVHFGLIGRVRLAWENGFWNEWYVLFDDGRFGWLAEAQGQLAILFDNVDDDARIDLEVHLRDLRICTDLLGRHLKIGGVQFIISDIKQAETIAAEGETPKLAMRGSKLTAIDLVADDGRFATLEFCGKNKVPQFFVGSWVLHSDLKFSNLRELEGWSPS